MDTEIVAMLQMNVLNKTFPMPQVTLYLDCKLMSRALLLCLILHSVINNIDRICWKALVELLWKNKTMPTGLSYWAWLLFVKWP